MKIHGMTPLALLAGALAAAGCGAPDDKAPAQPAAQAAKDGHEHDAHGDDHRGHAHEAPRGGTLVVLGDHLGHFELLLDAATGTLTAYALDGHAEHPVRLPDASIAVELLDAAGAVEATAVLSAVASGLTGETVGDTSQFAGASEALKGRTAFEGRLGALQFRGAAVPPTPFAFPGGNES